MASFPGAGSDIQDRCSSKSLGKRPQYGVSAANGHADRDGISSDNNKKNVLYKSASSPLMHQTSLDDIEGSSLNTTLLSTSPTRERQSSSRLPSVSPLLYLEASPRSSDTLGRTDREPGSNDDLHLLSIPLERVSSGRRTPQAKQRWKYKSMPVLIEIGTPRISSPRSVRDLGSSYTRYFSPSSDSARSSLVDLQYQRGLMSSNAPIPPNPFATPSGSTTNLDAGSEPEEEILLMDDRLGAPFDRDGISWPLFTDEKEDDDDMHMPAPDDDIKYRSRLRDRFSRDNASSTFGMVLMAIGILFIFVALPVMSSIGLIQYTSDYDTPLVQGYIPKSKDWAWVNDRKYPLLGNIRTGLVDPDTPSSAMVILGDYGDEFELVFSDEFNDNNRTFYEGDDPFWFAPDIWYGATQDLEWYDPDAVTTWDGTLELRLDKFANHGVGFRSGMLNSWNHVCMKGGILEVSVSLPGPAAVMGLWPGAWTMGNLGRPGYLSTTEGMWPYTYQACDVGITPNQSSYDGLSRLPGQRLSSCTCPEEDHPTPGTGRGAPEIDVLEAGASWGGLPIATQSYQVAPFDIWWQPDYEFTAFPNYSISYPNGYTGGPFQQAISATTNLNQMWYDGKAYQRYSFEYMPGEGEGSYIVWKVGGQTMFMMDGRAIGPNGNIQARQISEEPMSIVLNLGFSHSWTEITWDKLVFPTVMRIDYVRWYQKKGMHSVTCDPPGFETTQYIKDHMIAYTNPNLTVRGFVTSLQANANRL